MGLFSKAKKGMADAAGFGLAKSLFTGMLDDGVDPDEPGAVEAWIERFNALPDGPPAVVADGDPAPGPARVPVLPEVGQGGVGVSGCGGACLAGGRWCRGG